MARKYSAAGRPPLHGPSEKLRTIPNRRKDGELYARPSPDPFSPSWQAGFDDGVNKVTGLLGQYKAADYWDGYSTGELEREDLDRRGSSNT